MSLVDLPQITKMEKVKQKPYAKYFVSVWTGLFKDEKAKHYKKMGNAIWLFLSLLHSASDEGYIARLQFKTIHERTGISISTLKKFKARLRQHGYVKTWSSGRYLSIQINNWKHYKVKRRETEELLTKYLDEVNRSTEIDTSDSSEKKLLQNKKRLIGNRRKSMFSDKY